MASTTEEGTPCLLNIYYSTRGHFEECSFTWTIENLNFIAMGETYGYVIRSPTFPSSDERKCKWEVAFYPNGIDSNQADLILVRLHLKSTTASCPRIKTKCILSFHDIKNNQLETLPLDGVLTQACNLDGRLNREVLFKKRTLEDDILKIKVKINYKIGEVNELNENKESYGQVKSQCKLIEDLKDMLLDQMFSDIVIIVKGIEFQTHQNMIAARSPVLGAMLKHETKEKNQKRIIINDVEPEIMKQLLRFMYTSIVEFSNTDEASKVLMAADKYALDDLKELAEEYLSVNINTSNALNILNMADIHTALKLKTRVTDFICKNKDSFSSMSKTALNFFKNPQLLMEILAAVASDLETEKK